MIIGLGVYFAVILVINFIMLYMYYSKNIQVILYKAGILGYKDLETTMGLIMAYLFIIFINVLFSFLLSHTLKGTIGGPLFSGWAVLLLITNTIPFIVANILSNKRSLQVSYGVKKEKLAGSYIDFKLDVSTVIKKNTELYYMEKNYLENFALYKELVELKVLVNTDDIDENSPLIIQYILDNIVFLSTTMSILKDEKLVLSLSSKLGKQELSEILLEFETFNKGLKSVVKYLVSTKNSFVNAEKSKQVLDGLSEVRSMREFSKTLK